MATLESLPADQRAVLALVLQRGRTYDEIAEMLSIDRAAVRQRALQALDALGPHSEIDAGRRALITDYLLGQLPGRVAQDTHDRLAQSAPERAWARVVASELAQLASSPLPEIPAAASPTPEAPAPGAIKPRRTRQRRAPAPAPGPEPAAPEAPSPISAARPATALRERRSSRAGGIALLAAIAAVIVAVVLVLILSGGSSHKHTSTSASTPTTTTSPASVSTSTTSTGTPKVVAQINLASPTGSRAKAAVFVLRQGTKTAIVIQGQNVAPNTKHDAYAVWLYNTPSDSHLLGFVNPGVGSNGRLSTAGQLPANAAHYKQLLVTQETARNPSHPGTIVLQGALTGIG